MGSLSTAIAGYGEYPVLVGDDVVVCFTVTGKPCGGGFPELSSSIETAKATI